MTQTLTESNELMTVKMEKDTWILALPADLCRREGLPEGTLASLTFKNDAIQGSYIRPPSQKLQEIAQRLLIKNHQLYEELKRLGD